MITKEINITPRAALFRAEHERSIGWNPALYELIDNAFDAAATEVDVEINLQDRYVCVRDNGCGCDDLTRFFAKGERADHESTKSGHYGVGAKAAALYFWGRYRVTSWKNGIRYSGEVDWNEIERTGLMRATQNEEADSEGTGTLIEFFDIQRKLVRGSNLTAFLSEMFWPAIEDGNHRLRLFIGGHIQTVHANVLPRLQDRLFVSGEVNGLRYDAFAGLTIGDNPKGGFTLVKAHRVVISPWDHGLQERNLSRFFGVVYLRSREWRLTTLKDNLAVYSDELSQDLERQFADLLNRAESLTSDVAVRELADELNPALFGNGSRSRQRSDAGEKRQPVEPKNSGAKREAKATTGTGDNMNERVGRLSIEWAPLGDGFGLVHARKGGRFTKYVVRLNEDRPDLMELRLRKDKQLLRALVVMLLANHITASEPEENQRLLEQVEGETHANSFIRLMAMWWPRITQL